MDLALLPIALAMFPIGLSGILDCISMGKTVSVKTFIPKLISDSFFGFFVLFLVVIVYVFVYTFLLVDRWYINPWMLLGVMPPLHAQLVMHV